MVQGTGGLGCIESAWCSLQWGEQRMRLRHGGSFTSFLTLKYQLPVLCRDAVSIFFSSKQNFPQMPFQSFYPFLCWQVAVNGKPLLSESDGEVLLLVLYATRWGQGGDGVVLPEGPPANFQVLVVSEFIARINYLPPFFPQAVFSLLLSLLRTHSIEFKDSRGQHKMIFIRS